MKKNNRFLGLMLLSLLAGNAYADCAPSSGCSSCGEFTTSLPMPSYECRGVLPFQNYLATSDNRICGGWKGIYFGTGFGYGSVNYNFNIPGITPELFYTIANNRNNNTYLIEYVTVGFAHSSNHFFIAGELGYYYNSVTKPFFYEDPSVFTLETPALAPTATTITAPCGVRLDVNAQNHVAFDLLPGFVLSPNLTLYGRLGFEFSNYTWLRRVCYPQTIVQTELGEIIFVTVNDATIEDFGDTNDSQSDGVVDGRLGAGLAYRAGQYVSFHVNYVHVFGREARFIPNASIVNSFGPPLVLDDAGLPIPGVLTSDTSTLLAENSIDPSRNEVMIGLTINF